MLYQVAQHASDQERAIAFYRDVIGLPFLGSFPGLTFFDLGGGTRLLLEAGASSALLYIGVDDIDAACGRVRAAGIALESEPHIIHVHDGGLDQPPGTEEWMAFFRDSEGNLVGFSERRAP